MDVKEAISVLDDTNKDQVELEWGAELPLEFLEELRLTLKSFLTPQVLDALLLLYKELDKEPKDSEAFCYFVGHSVDGIDCRYAIGALNHFKKYRLDRTKELLKRCLEELNVL